MPKRQAKFNKACKTVPSTFRLDEDLLQELREEARRRGVSPSATLNYVVKSHVNWHFRSAQAGFINVRKSPVTRLFAKLGEDEIIQMAKQVALELREREHHAHGKGADYPVSDEAFQHLVGSFRLHVQVKRA